jgi:hypothetical protein
MTREYWWHLLDLKRHAFCGACGARRPSFASTFCESARRADHRAVVSLPKIHLKGCFAALSDTEVEFFRIRTAAGHEGWSMVLLKNGSFDWKVDYHGGWNRDCVINIEVSTKRFSVNIPAYVCHVSTVARRPGATSSRINHLCRQFGERILLKCGTQAPGIVPSHTSNFTPDGLSAAEYYTCSPTNLRCETMYLWSYSV